MPLRLALLPHEFLLAICRGEVVDGHAPTFDERLEAAKAAAPFYAPRLSNVAATISQRDPREMTDEELAFHIRSHARAAGEEWHPAKDGLQ